MERKSPSTVPNLPLGLLLSGDPCSGPGTRCKGCNMSWVSRNCNLSFHKLCPCCFTHVSSLKGCHAAMVPVKAGV